MMAHANLPDVDKLIDKIDTVLRSPSLLSLQELGIIAVPKPATSPSALAAIEHTTHHFGLKSWCLNPVYVACTTRLSKDPTDSAAAVSILVVNPDFNTAWNRRKACIGGETEEIQLKNELRLCSLILGRSPKSCDTWAHRHWVLKRMRTKSIEIDIAAELEICWIGASRAFSNYYASVHRVRVLSWIGDQMTLARELVKSRKWIATHVSDSSGWAYHRLLLQALDRLSPNDMQEETSWFSKMGDSYGGIYENITVHSKWMQSWTAGVSK